MNFKEDYDKWKEAIQNFPLENVKQPNLPVDDFAARTETLAVFAEEDRAVLEGSGLDGALIDELVPLTGALRYCQAEWMSEYHAQQEARQLWLEQSPQAFALRDELLHHFSFAYRKLQKMSKKVQRIREGGSQADMVQDLIELAVLGENNPEPLVAINFVPDKLKEARALSHHMSELLAQANGNEGDGNDKKIMRDKAFNLLTEKEREVREYGRYVFWKDDDKRNRYTL